MGSGDAGVERDVAPEVEFLVEVCKVLDELVPGWKALGPVPVPPEILDGELVDGVVRVDTGAGITVPIPGATQVACCLKDLDGETSAAESMQLISSAEASTDDQDIEGLHGGRKSTLGLSHHLLL